jgi:hypothetical protein
MERGSDPGSIGCWKNTTVLHPDPLPSLSPHKPDTFPDLRAMERGRG